MTTAVHKLGCEVHPDHGEWETPPEVFEELDREFHFNLDPAAWENNAKCAKYYTAAENGLLQDWAGHTVFLNPPYGRQISAWMAKAWEEGQRPGTVVVCLIPSRTDTAWWHDYVVRGEVRFLRGRIKFLRGGDAVTAAPFPSAVVIFRRHKPLGGLWSTLKEVMGWYAR